MKLHTLAAACAAFVSLSATAALAAEPVTVKLQSPVAQPVKFIAGGAIFNCEADTCVAGATTSNTFGSDTCKTVAAKVGAIAAFQGRRSLDEARLAQCNTAAAASSTALAKR
ncbi:MAG: hypothetical protein JWP50_420 [Phenylobacterium sp.]|nr:hypothetical protein [Phenylobacterium sp.]